MNGWNTQAKVVGSVRSCYSKMRFPDEWNAVGFCKKQHKTKKRFLKPYRCRDCNGFHTCTVTMAEFVQSVLGTTKNAAKWEYGEHGQTLTDQQSGFVIAKVDLPAKGEHRVTYQITGQEKQWAESFPDARTKIMKSIGWEK